MTSVAIGFGVLVFLALVGLALAVYALTPKADAHGGHGDHDAHGGGHDGGHHHHGPPWWQPYLIVILATYAVSVGHGLLFHCTYDTTCILDGSISDPGWLLWKELSWRWFATPGNWILIVFVATFNKLWGMKAPGTLFALFLWAFFGWTYIYGGYNSDPWDEVWRNTHPNPPELLQILFPVRFG